MENYQEALATEDGGKSTILSYRRWSNNEAEVRTVSVKGNREVFLVGWMCIDIDKRVYFIIRLNEIPLSTDL